MHLDFVIDHPGEVGLVHPHRTNPKQLFVSSLSRFYRDHDFDLQPSVVDQLYTSIAVALNGVSCVCFRAEHYQRYGAFHR